VKSVFASSPVDVHTGAMRILRWWLVGGALLAGSLPLSGATAPSGSPGDYAILGVSSVILGGGVVGGVQVEGGDVGANAKSGSVKLGPRSRVDGNVAAATIKIGRSAQTGDMFCENLDRTSRSTPACVAAPVDLPLVDVLPTVQADPGTERIQLGRLDERNGLPAGRYGVVRVGGRGHLGLAGGEYDFRYLRIGRRGALLCEGTAAPTCVIRVKDRMVLGEHGTIGANAPLDARSIRIEVAGNGPMAAFWSFRRSTISANIYAPNGHILLGGGGRYEGAFIGDSVEVLGRARVIAANGF
jgi:hypothetical protein